MAIATEGEHTEPIQTIHSLLTTILDLPPSCIEFCPYKPAYFVVGTYSLEKDDQEPSETSIQIRKGSLLLFSLEGEKSLVHSLKLHTSLDTESAVLDLHFAPHRRRFAVALSTGAIQLYDLTHIDTPELKLDFAIQVASSSILILSLAWHPSASRPATVACSLSDGRVVIVDFSQQPVYTRSFQSHSLEAWTVSWSLILDLENASKLYSGGDDSKLSTARLTLPPENRVPMQGSVKLAEEQIDEDDEQNTSTHIFDAKLHTAGVTAILPIVPEHGDGMEVLLTGSYDEFIRVLAPRANQKWVNVAERRLDGGVWRLKLMSTEGNRSTNESNWKVIASCMHAGSRILMIRGGAENIWGIDILAKFVEHESMNYGSDVTKLLPEDGSSGDEGAVVAASTSFYDRKLCIWKVP